MKKHSLGHPYWNALQVLAWVYTRNPRLVVLLSDRDEGDSFDPNRIDFLAMANRPGAEFANYTEAQKSIVSTLQEGRFRSLGRRVGVGKLEEIPTIEWIDLHIRLSILDGFAEAVGMTDNPPASIVGAPRWYGLWFKRDDVLELWPPTETEIEQAEPDSGAARSDVIDVDMLGAGQTDAEIDVMQGDAREGEQDAPPATHEPVESLTPEPPDKGEKPRAKRKRHVEEDAELRNRIKRVQAMARRKWPNPQKRPGVKPMAKHLANKHGTELGVGFETIRKILDGTYKVSKRLGIRGL